MLSQEHIILVSIILLLIYSATAVTAVTKRVSGMIIDEIILSKS